MNKRIEKKKEAQKRKALAELFNLVLRVNGLDSSQEQFNSDRPTVFLDFSGHIGEIGVRVFEEPWSRYKAEPTARFSVRTGMYDPRSEYDHEFDWEALKNTKEYLKSLL